jgi:hypothetical protein
MTDVILRFRSADLFRMVGWLAAGLALYWASIFVGSEHPQTQVILQKLANVTTFGWVGYWISRRALGRVELESYSATELSRLLPRAIVIAAAILAGATGL